MANNEGRTCPKCGMNLGQRHLCPVCDQTEENTEARPDSAVNIGAEEEALHASPAVSQTADYVSRVIEFIGGYMDDWDKEFNTFFDGLPGEHSYEEYYDVCSKVNGIFEKNKTDSDKVSGSMTIKVMNELKAVFPDLSDEEARGLAMDLLDYRIAPFPPRRSPEVMKMYLDAKRKNDSEAQYNLGLVYAHGKGVSEDKAEAAKWFRKAAEQGLAKAQFDLGYAYAHGKGVKADKAEAVKWYRKAAEQGHAGSQYNLGICYEHGCIVSKDKEEAEKWFRKAAKQGVAEARERLEELGCLWLPDSF